METSICMLILVLLVDMAFGRLLTESSKLVNPRDKPGRVLSEKMQRNPYDMDWSDLFDSEITNLEKRLQTDSDEMITNLFGETGTGSTNKEQAQRHLDDLVTQLRSLRSDMESMSSMHGQLKQRLASALRSKSDEQRNTMNLGSMVQDLHEISRTIAALSGSVDDLHERADDIRVVRTTETTRPADCGAVKRCNDNYGDGEYYVYPTGLGGQKVKAYCNGMDGPDPRAFITLHNPNTATYNYSLRYDTYSCSFRDRVGDVQSTFGKIRVNLEDMTVARYDFTFANVINEDPATNPESIKFGSGGGCTWDYMWRPDESCLAPGGFVIDTSGTGLIVDPQLQWTTYGYGGRNDGVIRSNNNRRQTAACDGWCAWCYPVGEMTLQLDPASYIIGDATEPVCT